MTQSIDEIRAQAEARWRRQGEQEHERRKEAGLATIRLVPGADGPPVFSHDFQAEFRSVLASLSENGVQVEAPFMALDAAGAVSGYTGELLVPFIQFVGPAIVLAVGAWLHKKASHKARIKIGDVEVEATMKDSLTKAELEKILQRALNARAKMDDKN